MLYQNLNNSWAFLSTLQSLKELYISDTVQSTIYYAYQLYPTITCQSTEDMTGIIKAE